MLEDKMPIEVNNKDYVVSTSDLEMFSELYKSTLELESKYDVTGRKEKAEELNDAYIRLRKIASKLVGAFSRKEDRYAQVSSSSSVICYDNVKFLNLIHSLLDSKDDYEVSTIEYINMGSNEEHYEDSFSILTTKEGLKTLNKVPGHYLFQKNYLLNTLKKLDIPFVVTGNDINRTIFNNDIATITVKDLDSNDKTKYEICYYEDENIHNALDKINKFVETNGVDLNGIEDKLLVNLINNMDKDKVLKLNNK